MTNVSIIGGMCAVDGISTHKGCTWKGQKVDGMLLDDENADTMLQWACADTGMWNAERKLTEFCTALPKQKAKGCIGVTINRQDDMSITKIETVQP